MVENVLGIDIGGTSIKLGVVCGEEVLESTSLRNTFKGKSNLLVEGIKEICDDYINRFNITKIGIGCPGNIVDGIVTFASNLGWKNYEILKDFSLRFPNCKIYVDNDGNAACKAEMKFGNLNNVSNGLFVTIGKGVGGAIIIDNKIVKGHNNKGGRFGHTVIHTNGRKCNCGRRGCFETYASVAGLLQTVKEQNQKWKNPEEQINIEKLSGYQIAKHLKDGNKMVATAINIWQKDIAEGLLDLCHIFDPSIIVIAGGITESGILTPDYLKRFLKNHNYGDCDIQLARFKGKTGLIGAASLID